MANYKIDNWSVPNDNLSLTDSYQDVYLNSTPKSQIYQLGWMTNSEKVMVRLEIDGEQIFELDLESLEDNWKLKSSDSANASSEMFHLVAITNNGWLFRPPTILLVDSTFRVQMKRTSGNRNLYRGKTVWGIR